MILRHTRYSRNRPFPTHSPLRYRLSARCLHFHARDLRPGVDPCQRTSSARCLRLCLPRIDVHMPRSSSPHQHSIGTGPHPDRCSARNKTIGTSRQEHRACVRIHVSRNPTLTSHDRPATATSCAILVTPTLILAGRGDETQSSQRSSPSRSFAFEKVQVAALSTPSATLLPLRAPLHRLFSRPPCSSTMSTSTI